MVLAVYDYRTDVRNILVEPEIRSRFMRMEPGEDGGPPHSHDLGHEIFIVLEGRAEFTIDGETGEVGPGQMCIALVDQLHTLKVLGDEPMTMYLSVTPHIQPTHTQWSADGKRMPHRFNSSNAYDVKTDTDTPLPELLNQLAKAIQLVEKAAKNAAIEQERYSEDLGNAIASDNLILASSLRNAIWDSMTGIFQKTAELADLWNNIAPRSGKT